MIILFRASSQEVAIEFSSMKAEDAPKRGFTKYGPGKGLFAEIEASKSIVIHSGVFKPAYFAAILARCLSSASARIFGRAPRYGISRYSNKANTNISEFL